MNLLKHYIMIFFVSMVPIVELRGAIPISQGFGLPLLQSYIICVIGNMLPVPVIFFFARKVLIWGKDKKFIGGFFTWCLDKGERGGEKLKEKAGKGLYVALLLFVSGRILESLSRKQIQRQLFWLSTMVIQVAGCAVISGIQS